MSVARVRQIEGDKRAQKPFLLEDAALKATRTNPVLSCRKIWVVRNCDCDLSAPLFNQVMLRQLSWRQMGAPRPEDRKEARPK